MLLPAIRKPEFSHEPGFSLFSMFPVDVFIREAIPGALMSTQTFACLNPDKFMIILLPLSKTKTH